MQTSMNFQDNNDEFEQAQEQFLTYHLSEQMPSSSVNTRPNKIINKTNERPKLGLMMIQKDQVDTVNYKEINKNIKKIQGSMGRIIKIGNVIFRSNFQCGNLLNVKIRSGNAYQIELEKETNSNRVSAWFYFSVQGLKGETFFIIKGFTKSSSLYNQGMKVCYRDVKEMSKWRRGGSRISYTYSEDQQNQKSQYELRFSHFFKNNQTTCIEFAYCFPYGLKKLYSLINNIKQVSQASVLCKTYNGQVLPLLTIGNKKSSKVIVLSARVHPGETVSSFIMQGFIKELVSDNQYGKLLRSTFLFKIVPMLNPDGVLKGNYRFSGYGCDLNRKWRSCKENSQPQIVHMKELIRSCNKEKKVIMYIDIHGHSRKKNVFFYGCCEKGHQNSKPKQFPYLMEKIFNAFKYQYCCFAVQKDKEGTARITVWKDLRIDYVYTLESTFCGAQYGTNYLEADYEKIGKKLCEGMAVFFSEEIQNSQSSKNIQKLSMLKKKVCAELLENPELLKVGQNDDSGSESQPQIGEITQKERNPDTGLPKPQALKDLREEARLRKIKVSTKFLSQQSIRETPSSKIKSEIYIDQDFSRRQTETPILRPNRVPNIILVQNDKPKAEGLQIKIANSVNPFQLDTLRASSLYQKNVRVHSTTKHSHDLSERSRKVVNAFSQNSSMQEKEERLRMNLVHGREGAQYRRVRKIAEQNLKRTTLLENGTVLKGPKTNKIQMESGSVAIAPRFYPLSQQRTRRVSLESYIKKQPRIQQLKKLSINGDELNVRSIGKQVYL